MQGSYADALIGSPIHKYAQSLKRLSIPCTYFSITQTPPFEQHTGISNTG